jgi:hypothetical protein
MTYAQACKQFRNRNGFSIIDLACKKLSSFCDGVDVYASKCVNEEHPKDNFLNIVFEYKAECSKDFEEIRLMLCYFLKIFGLELRYECNGDGEKGILMSYRVKEF